MGDGCAELERRLGVVGSGNERRGDAAANGGGNKRELGTCAP